MAAEAWTVSSVYRFTSNARTVLAETTAYADEASVALDRLSETFKAAQASMRSFMASQSRVRTSLGLTADVAEESATVFDAAYDRMAMSARRSAASVIASTRAIRQQLTGLNKSSASAGAGGAAASAGAGAGAGAGWVSKVSMGAGIAAALALASGIGVGSSIQSSAAQSAVAMGLKGTASQTPTEQAQAMLSPIAMKMSNMTAQSQAQSMRLMNILATSGLNTKDLLLGNGGALPMAIAQYADTQYLGPHHVAFDESARLGATISHQFGARTGAQIDPILNTLFKISQDMPDSVASAAKQLKFYAPQFTAAGVSPQDTLVLQATADRMGLGGGRSGTGFRQIYQSLIAPTAPQFAAQRALGFTAGGALGHGGHSKFIDRTGKLNINEFFAAVAGGLKAVQDKHGDVRAWQGRLAKVTTATGASDLTIFGSAAGQAQKQAVENTLKRVPSLQVAQAQLMGTLNGQFQRLITNVETLTGVLAGPLIKPLTDLLGNTANLVGNLATWFSTHPAAAGVGTAALVGGAAFGVVGALKGLAGFHAGIREFAHVGKLGISAREGLNLGTAAEDVARDPAIKSKFGTALADMFKFPATRAAVGKAFTSLGNPLVAKGPLAADITGGIKGVGQLFLDLVPGVKQVGGALQAMRFFAGPVGDILGMVAKRIAMFGLDAIPVVGEVAMLIQAIQFLGSHSKDIGKLVGMAAHWVVAHGAPMLRDAFVNVVKSIWQGIKDTWASLFNGGKGGLVGWLKDAFQNGVKGVQQGWNSEDNNHAYLVKQHELAAAKAKHDHVRAKPIRDQTRAVAVQTGPVYITVPKGTTQQQAGHIAGHLAKTGERASTPVLNAAMTSPVGSN